MMTATIAAITALIIALTTFTTTLITLAQVVKGRNVSVAQHTQLLQTVQAPRPVTAHGDTLVVEKPLEPEA